MERPEFQDDKGYLDKWEVYRLLEGAEFGPCQLPETDLLNLVSLDRLLSAHGSVYVKPLHAWGGRDISKISVSDGVVQWVCQGRSDLVYKTVADAYHGISLLYENMNAIVQATAPVVTFQNRPFDVRVHMQREWNGEWAFAGALARVGGAQSIVSNVEISEGMVYPVDALLRELFPFQHARHEAISAALQEVGYDVSAAMDACREFDELGLDLGLDRGGRLWLFEVNTNDVAGGPSHELFAQLPDKQVYEQMMKRLEVRTQKTLDVLFGELFAGLEDEETS